MTGAGIQKTSKKRIRRRRPYPIISKIAARAVVQTPSRFIVKILLATSKDIKIPSLSDGTTHCSLQLSSDFARLQSPFDMRLQKLQFENIGSFQFKRILNVFLHVYSPQFTSLDNSCPPYIEVHKFFSIKNLKIRSGLRF